MNAYLVWLVSSVVVGLVVAWIAKTKGRDPIKWFWAGVLLNVVALAIITSMRRAKR